MRSSPHFNSRAHVERDEQGMLSGMADEDFNSRAHVERDQRLFVIPLG